MTRQEFGTHGWKLGDVITMPDHWLLKIYKIPVIGVDFEKQCVQFRHPLVHGIIRWAFCGDIELVENK